MKDYSGHESAQTIHSKTKKYAPVFPKELPSIPSQEEFELTSVLGNLKEQTTDLLVALLEVAKNYEEDLNNEFKHKLDNEKKIQLKNKRMEKALKNMVKEAHNETKKLNRVLDSKVAKKNSTFSTFDMGSDRGADEELTSILEMSTKANSAIPKLCQSLHDIDKKVSGPMSSKIDKYPLLASIILDGAEPDLDTTIESTADHDASTAFLSARDAADLYIYGGTNTELSPQETINSTSAITKPLEQATPDSDDRDGKNNLSFPSEEDMNEEQFEYFMSTSIERYRLKQEQKYAGNAVFEDELLHIPSSAAPRDDFKQVQAQDVLNYPHGIRKSRSMMIDPVSLLKPSFTDNAIKKDQHARQELSSFPTTPMKSTATVKQSLQTSHFKKLRINGLPMTSSKLIQNEANEPQYQESSSATSRSPDDAINSLSQLTFYEAPDDVSSLDSESSNSFYLGVEYFGEFSPRMGVRRESRGTFSSHREEVSPTPKYQPSHHSLKPKRSILKSLATQNKIVNKDPDSPLKNKLRTSFSYQEPSQSRISSAGYSATPKFVPGKSQSSDTAINQSTTVTGTILHPSYSYHNSPSYHDKDVLAWIDTPKHSQGSDSQSIVSLSLLKEYLSNV